MPVAAPPPLSSWFTYVGIRAARPSRALSYTSFWNNYKSIFDWLIRIIEPNLETVSWISPHAPLKVNSLFKPFQFSVYFFLQITILAFSYINFFFLISLAKTAANYFGQSNLFQKLLLFPKLN
jgi:hypothetical protein